MFDVRELNIAIELWGMAFCIIGIACILLFGRVNERYRRLILLGFVFEFVAAGGDALAGFFRGGEGTLAWVLTHIGNWATFIGNFLLVAILTSYLVNRVSEAGGPDYRNWRRFVHVASLVMCALTLLGMFFSIDSSNIYHRSGWYWLAQAYVMFVFVVDAAWAIRSRQKLGGSTLACLLFYTLVPVVSAATQVFVYGVNFVVAAGVLALVVVFFEMQSYAAALTVRQTEELAASRVEVSESRIQVMVSQIQPHFLFNALDTIYGLVDEDEEAAKRAIASFSRYLRANLDSLSRTSPVPVEAEIAHVRTYLELERMADEGKIAYEIDAQAGGFSVPALSVQTLAENAVKHGIAKCENGGKVIVRTSELEREYAVTVIDNGIGFDQDAVFEGVGISNTRARLEAMCNGSLEIRSDSGQGTTVEMRVPKEAEVQI